MRSYFRCITLRCTDCPSTGAAFLKTSESIGPHTKIIPTWISFDEFCGNGPGRVGEACWFRLTEGWTAAAKSVFRFDIQGSWLNRRTPVCHGLLYLREHCGDRVHFWLSTAGVPSASGSLTEHRHEKKGEDGSEITITLSDIVPVWHHSFANWAERLLNKNSLENF